MMGWSVVYVDFSLIYHQYLDCRAFMLHSIWLTHSLSCTDLGFQKFRWCTQFVVLMQTNSFLRNWVLADCYRRQGTETRMMQPCLQTGAYAGCGWEMLSMLCLMLNIAKGCVRVGPRRGTVRAQLWACWRYSSCKLKVSDNLISASWISPWRHLSMCRITKGRPMLSRKHWSLILRMAR